MNAFPPPSTPPVDHPAPRGRRRGLLVGGMIGALALVAGGVVVGTALATDDGEPEPTEADLTAQTGNGDLDQMFGAVGPFLECLADNIDLEGLNVPADLDQLQPDELMQLVEEAMTAGTAAFEACSSELPTDFPDVVPGPEILAELGDLDLGDIPGFEDLYRELSQVLDLPPLEDAEAQLDEALESVPTWDELQEEFDKHLDDLDTDDFEEQLDDLGTFLEDLDLDQWEKQIDDLEEYLGELPSVDEFLGQLEEELGGVDLEQVFDDLFGDAAAPTAGG